MLVQVTEADIKEGIPRTSAYCPVALALKRKFPNSDITVYYTRIFIGGRWYRTPASVAMFIWKYDHDKPAMPFEFDLDKPLSW